jgi:hypothetical protein
MKSIITYSKRRQGFELTHLPVSETEFSILNRMQERLAFASHSLQRMEDESGIPLNQKQSTKVAAYFEIIRNIQQKLRAAKLIFTQS